MIDEERVTLAYSAQENCVMIRENDNKFSFFMTKEELIQYKIDVRAFYNAKINKIKEESE